MYITNTEQSMVNEKTSNVKTNLNIKAHLEKQSVIADKNSSEVECPSHLTLCEIVPVAEPNKLSPVHWIFTVPNDESLPRLIGPQPQSNTTIEAPKPAVAIQLTVDNSQSEESIDSSSLEIGGEAERENKEVKSGSCRFDGEGTEGRTYDENGFFYGLMVQNGWTMPKIINQDKELRFN